MQHDPPSSLPTTTTRKLTATTKRDLFLDRKWQCFWLGLAANGFTDMYNLVLTLWIVSLYGGKSWAPLVIGTTSTIGVLAVFLTSPLTGMLIDRWPKSRTLLYAKIIHALLLGCFWVPVVAWSLLFSQSAPLQVVLPIAYVVIVLDTLCGQFSMIAPTALIATFTDKSLRGQTLVYPGMIGSITGIVSPLLATFLFSLLGFSWALLFSALFALISALCFLPFRHMERMTPQKTELHPPFLEEVSAGARFIVKSRTLIMLLLVFFLYSCGDSVLAMNSLFITQNLHASPGLYGVLESTTSIGTLVVTIVVASLLSRFKIAKLAGIGCIFSGILLFVYARQTQVTPALVLYGLMGMVQRGTGLLLFPLLLQFVPAHLTARFQAATSIVLGLADIAVVALVSYLASILYHTHFILFGHSWDPIDTLYASGSLLIILAGLLFMRLRIPPMPKKQRITTPLPEHVAVSLPEDN
ncbi:MFS transporter [Ktedonospora formicarum]|uniref:Major facilitator superfamily (MFS) profile domain-containing protein n=1 Tax=Ktedonospora formicarum TaxID=2778364 RepID=A0A8J3I5B8_9CHLR|nr:MFS transporter [Ktedonospora formicarum]GHO47363.1 hypothetical protein KSX_55260 [Ktedonospora formicarum]